MLARIFTLTTKGLTQTQRLFVHNDNTVVSRPSGASSRNNKRSEISHWSKFKADEFKRYFQPKMEQLDSEIKRVIQDLNTELLNTAKISTQIESYLKSKENVNFLAYSSAGKINLLVALQMRANFTAFEFQKLRKLLLQHILRHETSNMALNGKELQVLIRNFEKFRYRQNEKLKWGNIKYLVIHLLHTSFTIIPLSFFPFVVTLINSQIKTSIIDNTKFIKIVSLLQEKFNSIFLHLLQEEMASEQYKFIYQHEFMKQLVQIYGLNGVASNAYAVTLCSFLKEKYFGKRFITNSQAISTFNVIFRGFPARGKTQKSQNCKMLIFQELRRIYDSNTPLNYENFSPKENYHLAYSILTHFFNSYAESLPLQQENGLTYLPQQSWTNEPPQLPSFFWKLYKKNAGYLNSNPIIKHTIQRCYPSEYIQTTQQIFQILQPSIESEMSIRVYESLMKLNLSFTTQRLLSGRYIDFCIEDNILLQVDGVFHFQPRILAYNENTNYRNAHFLLSGYKLMLINIYEYNVCRETEQLMELISKKLALLKEKAVFVQ